MRPYCCHSACCYGNIKTLLIYELNFHSLAVVLFATTVCVFLVMSYCFIERRSRDTEWCVRFSRITVGGDTRDPGTVVLFATPRRRIRDSTLSVISNPIVAIPSFLQCLDLFSKQRITYPNKQVSKLDFKSKQKITIKGRPTPGLKGLLQTTVQKRTDSYQHSHNSLNHKISSCS